MTDGKVRFTINNIDRGTASGVNTLTVRITPLNKEIRGITNELSKVILGKTALPNNIFNLAIGQSSDQITLFWEFVTPVDLDLQDVEIRRKPGETSATIANFNTAAPLVSVAGGVNRKSVPIDTFGEFTYLARTKDTSGNYSEDVQAVTFTSVAPSSEEPVFAFNEDSPSVNFAGITNTNAGEANYPSFTTSNSGGLTYATVPGTSAPSSITDNSNGSSSGWSATSDADDLLMGGASAHYTTAIRDMGVADFYRIELDFQGDQAVKSTFNDLKTDILSDTSEANTVSDTTIIKASGLGTLLGTTYGAEFDTNNKTLVDDSSAGITNSQNVFAIWNDGQHTGSVFSISAITKANPGVITTSAAHGLTGSTNRAIIHDVVGMTQINNQEIKLTRVSDTTLSIQALGGSALDTSSFDTYTSGGVIDQGDYSNSNSYALIAAVISADSIKLGNTFFANGNSTGGNVLANVGSAAGNTFKLVDLRDYNDSADFTFDGGGSDISRAITLRTSTTDNVYLGNGATGSNGNVNVVQFAASSINDGFQSFEAGEKQFRFMQLKFDITNINPNESDFTLDKIRYTISQQEKNFSTSVAYDAAPKTIDWSAKNFRKVPRVSVSTVDAGNAVFGVFTALSNTAGTVKIFKSDGTAKAADSSATINISATGV